MSIRARLARLEANVTPEAGPYELIVRRRVVDTDGTTVLEADERRTTVYHAGKDRPSDGVLQVNIVRRLVGVPG